MTQDGAKIQQRHAPRARGMYSRILVCMVLACIIPSHGMTVSAAQEVMMTAAAGNQYQDSLVPASTTATGIGSSYEELPVLPSKTFVNQHAILQVHLNINASEPSVRDAIYYHNKNWTVVLDEVVPVPTPRESADGESVTTTPSSDIHARQFVDPEWTVSPVSSSSPLAGRRALYFHQGVADLSFVVPALVSRTLVVSLWEHHAEASSSRLVTRRLANIHAMGDHTSRRGNPVVRVELQGTTTISPDAIQSRVGDVDHHSWLSSRFFQDLLPSSPPSWQMVASVVILFLLSRTLVLSSKAYSKRRRLRGVGSINNNEESTQDSNHVEGESSSETFEAGDANSDGESGYDASMSAEGGRPVSRRFLLINEDDSLDEDLLPPSVLRLHMGIGDFHDMSPQRLQELASSQRPGMNHTGVVASTLPATIQTTTVPEDATDSRRRTYCNFWSDDNNGLLSPARNETIAAVETTTASKAHCEEGLQVPVSEEDMQGSIDEEDPQGSIYHQQQQLVLVAPSTEEDDVSTVVVSHSTKSLPVALQEDYAPIVTGAVPSTLMYGRTVNFTEETRIEEECTAAAAPSNDLKQKLAIEAISDDGLAISTDERCATVNKLKVNIDQTDINPIAGRVDVSAQNHTSNGETDCGIPSTAQRLTLQPQDPLCEPTVDVSCIAPYDDTSSEDTEAAVQSNKRAASLFEGGVPAPTLRLLTERSSNADIKYLSTTKTNDKGLLDPPPFPPLDISTDCAEEASCVDVQEEEESNAYKTTMALCAGATFSLDEDIDISSERQASTETDSVTSEISAEASVDQLKANLMHGEQPSSADTDPQYHDVGTPQPTPSAGAVSTCSTVEQALRKDVGEAKERSLAVTEYSCASNTSKSFVLSPVPSIPKADRKEERKENWLQRLSNPPKRSGNSMEALEGTQLTSGILKSKPSQLLEREAHDTSTIYNHPTQAACITSSALSEPDVFDSTTPIASALKVDEVASEADDEDNWLKRLRSRTPAVPQIASTSTRPTRQSESQIVPSAAPVDNESSDFSYVSTLGADSDTEGSPDPFQFKPASVTPAIPTNALPKMEAKPTLGKRKRLFRGKRYGSAEKAAQAVPTGSAASVVPGEEDDSNNEVIIWKPTAAEKANLPPSKRKKRRPFGNSNSGNVIVPDVVSSLMGAAEKASAPCWEYSQEASDVPATRAVSKKCKTLRRTRSAVAESSNDGGRSGNQKPRQAPGLATRTPRVPKSIKVPHSRQVKRPRTIETCTL
jgi:hypothetical protein